MSRKKTTHNIDNNIIDNIIEQEFSEAIDENFMRYAFKVLEDRALPDARDGLKPSQRRSIYCMHETLGLASSGKLAKCAKVSGAISGDFHPHGDQVIYPTIVRMAQPWNIRYPLIHGQGNFGDIDGSPPAALRYTECKLTKYGEMLVSDISKEIVSYVSTYNDEKEEPTVLPSLIPNLIINGASGIAVGYASSLAPHNLTEVCKVIKSYVKDNSITADDILKIMPGPDFPVRCKINGQNDIKNYYETGKGNLKLEGFYDIESDKTGKPIIRITSFPYGASPKKFIKQIQELIQNKKIEGIVDLKNLSKEENRQSKINVILWIGKGYNPQTILNQLLRYTCLVETFSVNSTVLIDGKKVTENVPMVKLIEVFVNHRKAIINNTLIHERNKREHRLHILEGLLLVSKNINKVIKLIQDSDNRQEAKNKLIDEKIVKSEAQAHAVISVTLGALTKLEHSSLTAEYDENILRLDYLKSTIDNQEKLNSLIIQEQDSVIKAAGDERITEINLNPVELKHEDLILDEKIEISIDSFGFIKKIKNDDLNSKILLNSFKASSKDYILFFTQDGFVYKKQCHQIPESSKNSKGIHIANLLKFDNELEKIIDYVHVSSFEDKKYIIMSTKNGLIKKTEIYLYDTKYKDKRTQSIKLNDKDEVISANLADESDNIILISSTGHAIRYPQAAVSCSGRVTAGSRGIKLDKTDSLIKMITFKNINTNAVIITPNGYGKKIKIVDIKESLNKNTKGNSLVNKINLVKHGNICSASLVENDMNVITKNNQEYIIPKDKNKINEIQSSLSKIIELNEKDMVIKIGSY